MESWRIMPITEEDIDQIIEIENVLFQKPWSRTSCLHELTCEGSYSFGIVFTDPDRPTQFIAYIFFRIIMDEMHLFRIGVAQKWQKKGFATYLFQQSIQLASEKGADTVYLEVRTSNTPAISLYHKLGFRLIGKRPRYYPETNEDALVLMKQIDLTFSQSSAQIMPGQS
ncbi:MAG: ribosomal protein S18-alanine N-acetyltransferase [Pseudomonadota bacterium]